MHPVDTLPSARPAEPTEARPALILALMGSLLLVSLLSPVAFMGGVQAQSDQPMKEKTFYLHTLDETVSVAGTSTQTIMNTTVGTNEENITSVMRIIARWLLFPELAADMTLNGTVTMTLWWTADVSGGAASWNLTVREVFSDGSVETIVRGDQVSRSVTTADTFEQDSASVSINHTFSAGSTVEAHINIVGDSSTTYTIAWGSATRDSRVILPAEDYMRIVPQAEGGILILDSNREATTNLDSDADNKTVYFQVTVTDPFGGYDIVWVNLTVEAPNGTVIADLDNVSMPQISGFFNSFESVFEVEWNYSGFPDGRYNITVFALDNNGHLAWQETGDFGGHDEVAEGVFYIGAPPIEVHILVLDGDGRELADALVRVLLKDDVQASGTTNASGRLKVNLAPGIYTLQVWWKETLVGSHSLDATDDIPFDAPFEAAADVFDVVFSAVDSQGVGLAEAAMVVRFPNGTVSDPPFVLDAQGNLSLFLTPGGTYDLTVLWAGKVVAERTFDVQASGTYLVATSVFYVDFTAVDAKGAAVENALVTVTEPGQGTFLESRLTDPQGSLVSRLPLGSFKVSVTWFGISVMEPQPLEVTGDLQRTLNLTIFETEFAPVDSRGVLLQDASVRVTSGAFTQIGNTLNEGFFRVRIPAGDYQVLVVWQGVVVFDATRTVDGSAARLEIPAQVFYLTVTVQDANGSPLSDAFVTVRRDAATVATAETGADGTAEFRLPTGGYQVEVVYRTTYLLTEVSGEGGADVDLAQDASAKVTIVSFPPPVHMTVLFYVLIAVAAIVAGLAYVVLKLKEVI